MRLDLRAFAKEAWSLVDPTPLVWGWHLDAICDHLTYISLGDIRFFLCNLPPRSSKSLISAVIWPVFDWIMTPTRAWLTASYSLQLSKRDCLKSRRLLESRWFQERWPIPFTFDEKLKQQYSNVYGGRRVSISTESTATGEGGNIILLDDPHNAQEAESPVVRERTCKWWDATLASRLNNQNIDRWAVMGQLTNPEDLFHHIRNTFDMSDVVQLILPNEFDRKRRCVTRIPASRVKIFRDPRTKQGELLMPQRLNEEASKRLKRSMKTKYNLQYQQSTDGGDGNLISKDHWIPWEGDPPEVDHIITAWDTAYGQKQKNDYSARTDWGIFKHSAIKEVPVLDREGNQLMDDEGNPRTRRQKMPERWCVILLGGWKGRPKPHELRRKAKEHYFRVRPDYTLIEKKVSGIDVINSFRLLGIQSVRPINIDHGGRVQMDMTQRMNMISEMFEDGCVYYLPRISTQEVIQEVCAWPEVAHDDYCSTVSMALQWARRRGEMKLWEDEEEDGTVRLFKQRKSIYG
jgi:phage terminase large subunit-like protein